MVWHRVAPFGMLLVALILGLTPMTALAQDALSEQFVSSGGSLSFSFPAGWVVLEEDGLTILTNDEAALDSDMPPPGAVAVLVADPATLRMLVYDLPDTRPESVATAVAEAVSGGMLETLPAPETMMLGDRPAARLSLEQEGIQVLVIAIAVSEENTLALVAMSAPGEMRRFEQTVVAVAGTILYTSPWSSVLAGHDSYVLAVSFRPDGTQLASGSSDGTVRVWDVASGAEVAVLEPSFEVVSVAYRPDGARLAAASRDDKVYIWDAETGAELLAITLPDLANAIAYSPDGARIASAHVDGMVRVWDADTGAAVATLEGHESTVRSVAYSPDGRLIASGGEDSSAIVWDAATGAQRFQMPHPDWVRSVAFSPDSALLVTGGDDEIVRVWRADTGAAVAELLGHTDWVRAVAFSPDGTQIASGDDAAVVRVWQSDGSGGFSEAATFRGHMDWVRAVAFSPDGTLIASGSDDAAVFLWNAPR